MPAEIRTSPSVMPSAARRSAGTDACVIVAGWRDQGLDAAEALGERDEPDAPRARSRGASSEPISKASMPPKPCIWRVASACCGWEGRPG